MRLSGDIVFLEESRVRKHEEQGLSLSPGLFGMIRLCCRPDGLRGDEHLEELLLQVSAGRTDGAQTGRH